MRVFGKFIIVPIIILCMIGGLVAGCGNKDVDTSSKVLRVALEEDPDYTDVQKTTDDYGVPLNIFDRLVEAVTVSPGKSEIVPGLAKSWDVSDDGLVYVFHLRDDVKFHNGEKFKADDVLYTFDRMLEPKTKALNTDFLDMIEGARERMDGEVDSVKGLKVIDDYTIEITLAAPYAPFLANLATPAGSVYNRKATTEAGEEFGIDPKKTIGTGPFKMKSWELNDAIVLEANTEYFKGRPDLDEIHFKILPDPETQRMLFETGELDVFDCDNARSQIPYFEEHEKWSKNIVSGPRVGVYYYCINESIKPFDDVRVRKALQLLIDRKTLLEKMYYGKGIVANGIMPPGLAGYNPDLEEIPYDVEKAKDLLAQAGYSNGFEMEIAQITDSSSSLKINEAVQAMFKEVGIEVTIKQMDSATFYATRKEGKLPMYYASWSADFNDPDNFIYTFFQPDNSKNRSFNYNNPEVAKKLEKARGMVNQEERYKLYQDLEKIIVGEDAAWIPLFSLEHLFVVQPYVKNFKVSWNGWSNMPYYEIKIEK